MSRDWDEIARQVNSVLDSFVYIKLVPEVIDFTSRESGQLVLCTARGEATIPYEYLECDRFFALLENALDDADAIVAFNFKNLVDLRWKHEKKPFTWGEKVWDLRVIEGYLGKTRLEAPQGFLDAQSRLMAATVDPCWKMPYKTVYLPLINSVIPRMETYGLVSDETNGLVYPYFEVEGTKQGRLKALKLWSSGFMAHGNNDHLRARIGDVVMNLDYRNLEVAVLAYISKDPKLTAIINSGFDVYSLIWELLTNSKAVPESREFCKKFFLPVAYGMGENTLSRDLSINLETSGVLIRKTSDIFPRMTDFLRNAQNNDGVVRDHFGRPRVFDDRYKIRNFLIQSPAALLCLERLVALDIAIRDSAYLTHHVHDGYYISCPKRESERIFEVAKGVLEEGSPLFPGLSLKVSGKQGERLDTMVPIP